MRLEIDKHVELEQLAAEIEAAGYPHPEFSAHDYGLDREGKPRPGWVEITNGVDVPDFADFVKRHVAKPRPPTRIEVLKAKPTWTNAERDELLRLLLQ